VKLIFVNHAHPYLPHVSGIRLWRFAQEMVKRGHQVIHITATLNGETGVSNEQIERLLNEHRWTVPLHLPVKPVFRHALDAARRNVVPAKIRRIITAYALFARGGVFYDWTDAAHDLVAPLSRYFLPEVVWGTFGNSSNLFLARSIAKKAKCVLVIDCKDSISSFVPKLAHTVVAGLYREAHCFTANALDLSRETSSFFGRECHTLYSGVDSCFRVNGSEALNGTEDRIFDLTLTGSIYSEHELHNFMCGLKQWRDQNERKLGREVKLTYVGAEYRVVQRMAASLGIENWAKSNPYVPLPEVARVCRKASANVYLKGGGFHQKLLELLATKNPVIAYGGETQESLSLAEEFGGELHAPANALDLAEALDKIAYRMTAPREHSMNASDIFSWENQAVQLERLINMAVQKV